MSFTHLTYADWLVFYTILQNISLIKLLLIPLQQLNMSFCFLIPGKIIRLCPFSYQTLLTTTIFFFLHNKKWFSQISNFHFLTHGLESTRLLFLAVLFCHKFSGFLKFLFWVSIRAVASSWCRLRLKMSTLTCMLRHSDKSSYPYISILKHTTNVTRLPHRFMLRVTV